MSLVISMSINLLLVLYRLKQLILEKWTRRERNEGTRALEGELERLSDGLFEG